MPVIQKENPPIRLYARFLFRERIVIAMEQGEVFDLSIDLLVVRAQSRGSPRTRVRGGAQLCAASISRKTFLWHRAHPYDHVDQLLGLLVYFIMCCSVVTQGKTLPEPALLSPEAYLKMEPAAVQALCGYKEEELKKFEKEVLDTHNLYRRRHGTHPLRFSKVCIYFNYKILYNIFCITTRNQSSFQLPI